MEYDGIKQLVHRVVTGPQNVSLVRIHTSDFGCGSTRKQYRISDGTFAKARITLTNVTTHTGSFEHLEYKKGFITLVLNYTVENLDNFAFYAQPDFDAIVDGDTYPYQAISGALGNLLLPHETRESFVIFQVVEDTKEVIFDLRDVYSGKDNQKSLWNVSVDIT